jgi:hypothetical protein
MRISEAVFRELELVRGMWVGRAAAQGGAQRAAAELRGRLEKPPA